MRSIFTDSIIFVFLLGLCMNPFETSAQSKIKLTGKVIDDDTEEAVAFADVVVDVSTGLAFNADLDGMYTIEFLPSVSGSDSIASGLLGYERNLKKFNRQLLDSFQTINFRLKSSAVSAPEVVVLAGENPANAIVRNIIKNKKLNDPAERESYRAELYSKVELDLANITPEMKDKKIFSKFQFIFDNVDSLSDVRPFLPAYMAERLYDVYYLKSARERKEMLKAQNVSGINNNSVVEFIDMMHEKYNVYDNWINLLGKEFASPFSNSGLAYYDYYIQDSTFIKGVWSYKLKFKPRRRQENTFFGDFWVSMEDYAVQIVNMRMSQDVNINLVNRIIIYAEFARGQDSIWLPSKEKTVIDFSSSQKDNPDEKGKAKGMSVIGRTTYSYKNFDLDAGVKPAEFRKLDPNSIVAANLNQPEEAWDSLRHEKLTANEKNVYKMVDSIKTVPIYKTWTSILTLLGTGMQTIGPIAIGQYWDIINYNRCEGYRIGMGIGTSPKLSKKFYLYGYAGYGLEDKRWKYSGDFQYVFNREKQTKIGLWYNNNVGFENVNSEETRAQSMMAGWLRRPVTPKILGIQEAKIFYQQGWKNGIKTRLALIHRSLTPQSYYYVTETPGYQFRFQPNANDSTRLDTSVNTFESVFTFRFAYREKLLFGNFSAISLGSKYPILSVQYTNGAKGVLGSRYNYHKFTIKLDDWFKIGIAGWVDYNIKMGITLGTVPYLLLESHPGNEAYFYNISSFNSMNSMEFASDKYISWRIEHHMDGLIFDKLPLIRRLKLRSVWAFRGVWGTLSDANVYANRFNQYTYTGDSKGATQTYFGRFGNLPYMEASAGIENIFKVLRVDALWRLTYRDNPNTQKFSVRVTLGFNF